MSTALSRSGLKRMFVGNTAENILDKLDCDVLIVKPRRQRDAATIRRALSRS